MIKLASAGKPPVEIHASLRERRESADVAVPDLTAVRKFLKGKTHKRGKTETRGRKRTLTRRNVKTMDITRRALVKLGKGNQVKWDQIVRTSRVPRVHRTTAARAFLTEGVKARWRRCREKPQRTLEQEAERKLLCGRMRRWPLSRFTDDIDLIIDNKKWDIPTTARAREYMRRQNVVGQIRTPGEGLEKMFTKPNNKRHRLNPGGGAHVCAGVSNCRIVLWEYFGGRWNGEKAAEMYRGPIRRALKRHRGDKGSYLVAEDNDPTGYKSTKGIEAKDKVGIKTVEWPRYSPDLMPLDFSLWKNIELRMAGSAPSGRESVADYKIRLRRTALATPTAYVRKVVGHMKERAKLIWLADGGNIKRD
jgi:hypothetical protein